MQLRTFAAFLSGLAFAVRAARAAEASSAQRHPEDRSCGVVRDDLRVPLALEVTPWTMRGLSTLWLSRDPAGLAVHEPLAAVMIGLEVVGVRATAIALALQEMISRAPLRMSFFATC